MPSDLARMLRLSAASRADRPQLVIPALSEVHSRYCTELVDNQLSACGRIIKAKGLYRWRKHSGPAVLVIWDRESKQFINFDNAGFAQWLGANCDLQDRMGMHFGLPHAAVASRIWETLLQDSSGLPWASWQLTDEYRKAGK